MGNGVSRTQDVRLDGHGRLPPDHGYHFTS